MAGGEWLRDGDDRAAECEASRVVSEAPAGGEGGETGVVEVSLSVFLRRVLAFLCLPVLVLACAQKYYYVNDIELQQKWLPFLVDGKTTKEEVESKFGSSYYYDVWGVHYTNVIKYKDGRIWTYIMLITEEGPPQPVSWGHYHLVLVFNENNILKKHSLLRFRP